MKTIFAKFCVSFGLLVVVLGILLMCGWSPTGTTTQELCTSVPLLVCYAVTVSVTFPIYRVHSAWKPLVRISDLQKKMAHLALILALVNSGMFLLVSFVQRLIGGPPLTPMVSRVVGSFMLLNGIYFVIHWAYRP